VAESIAVVECLFNLILTALGRLRDVTARVSRGVTAKSVAGDGKPAIRGPGVVGCQAFIRIPGRVSGAEEIALDEALGVLVAGCSGKAISRARSPMLPKQ
jgi:hypothetical protein